MTYTIKRELKKLGNRQFSEDIKNYINSPYEFYGNRVPELKTMAKRLHEENSLKEFYKIFNNLWRSGHNDKISLAIYTLQLYKNEFDLNTWKFIKTKLKDLKSWDQIDAIGSNILGVILLKYPEIEKEVVKMSKNNIWLKRMSIMSAIPLIKKGDLKLMLELLGLYIEEKDGSIQEATGVVLREAGRKKPEQTKRFILKHIQMPAITFNYATEDMKDLRKVRRLKKLKQDNNGGFLWRILKQ